MDENTDHYNNLTQSAESLCYFTAYVAEDRHKLPQDTSQALQHRVDPNSGQRERETVEILLYTGGCEWLLVLYLMMLLLLLLFLFTKKILNAQIVCCSYVCHIF